MEYTIISRRRARAGDHVDGALCGAAMAKLLYNGKHADRLRPDEARRRLPQLSLLRAATGPGEYTGTSSTSLPGC